MSKGKYDLDFCCSEFECLNDTWNGERCANCGASCDDCEMKPESCKEVNKLKESDFVKNIRKADRIHRFPAKMNPALATHILAGRRTDR